jgi:class 3 adenylate cyclase
MYRHGMRTLLSTLPDTRVVGEASTGEAAIALVDELRPHLVLMDLGLPGINGIEATRRITQLHPHVGILVMTMFQDDQSVYDAIQAGAHGYVLKDAGEEEMIRAVRAVGHGEAIFSPETVPMLRRRLGGAGPCAPSGDGAEGAVSSILTFLVADIRGYTRFTDEWGDQAAADLTVRFARLAEDVARSWQGRVVETRGDEVLAVFTSARRALQAAVDLQSELARARTAHPSLPLQCGVGLDAGEAIPVRDGYRGGSLILAARLCSIAGPGEVLCSEAVLHVARKTEGIATVDRGNVSLKGLASPVRVIQVAPAEELPPLLPALPTAGDAAMGRREVDGSLVAALDHGKGMAPGA